MSSQTPTRREFLHHTSTCLALALGVLGLGPELSALPRAEVESTTQGSEKRYPMPSADGVSIDAASQIIVVRYQAQVFALALACPHEHAAVKWVASAGRFQCSKHNSRYEPTGRYVTGRSTRNLDRFPVRLDGTSVVVDASKVWQADTNPTEWAAAAIPVS